MHPRIEKEFGFNGKFARHLEGLLLAAAGDASTVEALMDENAQSFLHVRYWVRYGAPNWRRYETMADIIREANAWHAEFAARNSEKGHPSLYTTGPGTDRPGHEVRVGDELMWVVQIPWEDAVNEGNLMGHCIGKYNQPEEIRDLEMFAFSLRDASNAPHVTWGWKSPKRKRDIMWNVLLSDEDDMMKERYPEVMAAALGEVPDHIYDEEADGVAISMIIESGDPPEAAAFAREMRSHRGERAFWEVFEADDLEFDQLQGKEDRAPVSKYRAFLREYFSKTRRGPESDSMWGLRTRDDSEIVERLMDGHVEMDEVLDAFDEADLPQLYRAGIYEILQVGGDIRKFEGEPRFLAEMVLYAMRGAGAGWSAEEPEADPETDPDGTYLDFLSRVLWGSKENLRAILESSYEVLAGRSFQGTAYFSLYDLPGGREFLISKLREEEGPSVLYALIDHVATDVKTGRTQSSPNLRTAPNFSSDSPAVNDRELLEAIRDARVRLNEMMDFEDGAFGLRANEDHAITEDGSALGIAESMLWMNGSDEDLAAGLTTLSRSLDGAALSGEGNWDRLREWVFELYRRDPDKLERVLGMLDPEVAWHLGLDRNIHHYFYNVDTHGPPLRHKDPRGQSKLEIEDDGASSSWRSWDSPTATWSYPFTNHVDFVEQARRATDRGLDDLNERRRRSVVEFDPPQSKLQQSFRFSSLISDLEDANEWKLADNLERVTS